MLRLAAAAESLDPSSQVLLLHAAAKVSEISQTLFLVVSLLLCLLFNFFAPSFAGLSLATFISVCLFGIESVSVCCFPVCLSVSLPFLPLLRSLLVAPCLCL